MLAISCLYLLGSWLFFLVFGVEVVPCVMGMEKVKNPCQMVPDVQFVSIIMRESGVAGEQPIRGGDIQVSDRYLAPVGDMERYIFCGSVHHHP